MTIFVCYNPTSPLRTCMDIDKSIKNIIEKKSTSLVSISKLINSNFEVSLNDKGFLCKNSKKNNKYYINGALYISKIRKKNY